MLDKGFDAPRLSALLPSVPPAAHAHARIGKAEARILMPQGRAAVRTGPPCQSWHWANQVQMQWPNKCNEQTNVVSESYGRHVDVELTLVTRARDVTTNRCWCGAECRVSSDDTIQRRLLHDRLVG